MKFTIILPQSPLPLTRNFGGATVPVAAAHSTTILNVVLTSTGIEYEQRIFTLIQVRILL